MSAYVISVLAIMAINVMLAVSLNMISGFCGQFSLGHAAFYGAGAYGAAFFAAAGTPLPVALLAGVFDPPPEAVTMPYGYLAIVVIGVAVVAATVVVAFQHAHARVDPAALKAE